MQGLRFDPSVPAPKRQPWIKLIETLQATDFSRNATANPEVFEYGVAQLDGNHVYCFVFYGSYVVYALPLGDVRELNSLRG